MCDTCNTLLELDNIKIPKDHHQMYIRHNILIKKTLAIYCCNECKSDICQECYQKM